MKRLLAGFCAIVLVAAAEAAAAPCTTGTCEINGLNGTTVLDFDNPVAIEDNNVALGGYLAEGTIGVAPGLSAILVEADISFSSPPPGREFPPTGFADFAVELFQDGSVIDSRMLTNPNAIGLMLPIAYTVALMSDSDIFFRITGVSVRYSGAALPDYNINVSAIPVPAAGWLALSGLAGLMFAAGRSKRAE